MNRSLKKSGRRVAVLIAVGLLALGAISLAAIFRSPQFIQVAGNPLVRIEIKDVRPGDVRFFAYRDRAGDRIRFLLARDSNGRTEAAFDACQRCYVYGKGYVCSGGHLVCRYCGNRYRLEAMESGLASCRPVKLPIQIVGQTVNIKSEDLEHERGLF